MDKAEVRRKVESIPFEERKKRNNVEVAMFLYSFHTRNNKTRYRTLFTTACKQLQDAFG